VRSTVVLTSRSLTSKVPRSPNLRPDQRESCPPFITPCFESVIGSYNWDFRIPRCTSSPVQTERGPKLGNEVTVPVWSYPDWPLEGRFLYERDSSSHCFVVVSGSPRLRLRRKHYRGTHSRHSQCAFNECGVCLRADGLRGLNVHREFLHRGLYGHHARHRRHRICTTAAGRGTNGRRSSGQVCLCGEPGRECHRPRSTGMVR